jgi:hypothetical protein
VDWCAVEAQKSWKQPFKIVGFVFMGILSKLSPPRRVYLLFNLIFATLSLVGFSFMFVTREIELLVAFLGMLILLVMVLADPLTQRKPFQVVQQRRQAQNLAVALMVA